MSSHHIIRDEQEPALIILDPLAIDREHLNGLLEWSPTILVSDKHAQQLINWGVKIDLVITSPDSYFDNSQKELFDHLVLDDNRSELDGGLTYLLKKNHHSVNVVGNPDNEPVFLHPLIGQMNCVLFEANKKIIMVRTGIHRKWYSAHIMLTIQPLEMMYLSSDGLFEDLENQKVDDELRLITTEDGILKLQSNLKPFLLVEEL